MPKEIYLNKPCMEYTERELIDLTTFLRRKYKKTELSWVGVPKDQLCKMIEDKIDETHVLNRHTVQDLMTRISNDLVMSLALDPEGPDKDMKIDALRQFGAKEELSNLTPEQIEQEHQSRIQKDQERALKNMLRREQRRLEKSSSPARRRKSPRNLAGGKRRKRTQPSPVEDEMFADFTT